MRALELQENSIKLIAKTIENVNCFILIKFKRLENKIKNIARNNNANRYYSKENSY